MWGRPELRRSLPGQVEFLGVQLPAGRLALAPGTLERSDANGPFSDQPCLGVEVRGHWTQDCGLTWSPSGQNSGRVRLRVTLLHSPEDIWARP